MIYDVLFFLFFLPFRNGLFVEFSNSGFQIILILMMLSYCDVNTLLLQM